MFRRRHQQWEQQAIARQMLSRLCGGSRNGRSQSSSKGRWLLGTPRHTHTRSSPLPHRWNYLQANLKAYKAPFQPIARKVAGRLTSHSGRVSKRDDPHSLPSAHRRPGARRQYTAEAVAPEYPRASSGRVLDCLVLSRAALGLTRPRQSMPSHRVSARPGASYWVRKGER
jgi:hypothetical protein